MSIPPEELEKRLNHFKEGLRRSGIKVTHQRLEIFHEVAKSSDHPGVDSIFQGVRERVPTVSLDTVYRTLWLLLDLGLLTTLGSSRERVRFDANMRSHHHFVCSRCGMTRDFYSKELDELKIPQSVPSFGQVETRHVEVRGVCLGCISNEKPKPKTLKNEEGKL